MKSLPTPGPTFTLRKGKILSQLAVPDEQYSDASPKGSVDAGIRDLIAQINAHAGLVTTSSCAGRVSVYLEGRKSGSAQVGGETAGLGSVDDGGGDGNALGDERSQQMNGSGGGDAASSAGGKGGGEWLFVSHDPVPARPEGYEELLGLGLGLSGEEAVQDVGSAEVPRLIHFKFEPMILHVLTASLEHAQLVIQAGMEAGFRETGAVSLLKKQPDEEATPIVAVRSMGLSFESLIGAERDGVKQPLVAPEYLRTLVQIANERFVENEKRITRFSTALEAAFAPPKGKEGWEDAQARRERKRQEGLRRREELKKQEKQPADEPSLDFVLQQPDVL